MKPLENFSAEEINDAVKRVCQKRQSTDEKRDEKRAGIISRNLAESCELWEFVQIIAEAKKKGILPQLEGVPNDLLYILSGIAIGVEIGYELGDVTLPRSTSEESGARAEGQVPTGRPTEGTQSATPPQKFPKVGVLEMTPERNARMKSAAMRGCDALDGLAPLEAFAVLAMLMDSLEAKCDVKMNGIMRMQKGDQHDS